MNKEEYAQYLSSLHWKAVRLRKLADIPFCEYCGSRAGLEVHHSSYAHLSREDLDKDLIVLCRNCHLEEHDENPTKYERGLVAFVRSKYHCSIESINREAVEREFRAWIGIDRRGRD
jgi:5-methylcytosine-specific restriction endonuclease McrA